MASASRSDKSYVNLFAISQSPRDVFLPFLLENGKASWELCRLLVRRMERASAILGELAFQPVAGRVARLLLDHFKEGDDDRLKCDLTLDEMAARGGPTGKWFAVCYTVFLTRA